ncbi:DUF5053 domain-containing protein [Parabacteroides sp. AF48-14]|uniref:DUF5053 domain-containing protein n=1 Tax=Parabacteroides sp. AF48-14 TaxID=2292052 RepID=UPI000EFE19FC|nr:DUF5053 domain-containing protein [Parabacteroides sp. AF48-14]RHO74615.1 DUF5053 domain-containing protein [Parabacteroides sp. AF48-14]
MAGYEELKKDFLLMREKFNNLEENARSSFQEYIDQYVAHKTPEEARMIADIMLECINEDIDKVDVLIRETRLRKVLEKVYDAVSWSYIAKTYFGKSRSWLNQRLNNFLVNGKEVQFTPEELGQLQKALFDLSGDIRNTALELGVH